MAGHSKWANIKHRKAAQDAKRGKLFTKFIRELTVAAREGGSDPDANPRLRAAIDKSLSNNMTRDTVERAIKRGAGEIEGHCALFAHPFHPLLAQVNALVAKFGRAELGHVGRGIGQHDALAADIGQGFVRRVLLHDDEAVAVGLGGGHKLVAMIAQCPGRVVAGARHGAGHDQRWPCAPWVSGHRHA